MNYYERHLGDYAKDTAHLSMVEHGAYTLLLDRYYATEQPIPADQAHRIARARSKDERAAVDAVLAEFFTLSDGVWRNGRTEREIADYKESEPEREHKRENAKERQQRARERRRSIFETLRQHGIVPAYDASMNELQAALSRIPESQRHAPVTRDATATSPQTPDTIPSEPTVLQGERSTRSRSPTRPDDVDAQTWADWLALRKAKRAPVSATTLEEARKQAGIAGMTLEAFLRIWCSRGSQGLEAAWLRADERPRGPAANVESFRERDQRAAAERVAAFTGRRPADTRPTFEAEVIDVTPKQLGR